jgi:pyruvyltransferase
VLKLATPSDSFWAAAVAALESMRPDGVAVLGSPGLEAFVPGLFPLEFSWALTDRPFLFCASKDDIHRLAAPLFADGTPVCWWGNEVFVIGAVGLAAPEGLPSAASLPHLESWKDQAEARRLGCVTSQIHRLPERTAPPSRPLRVLVLGASAMGNVGDDLLGRLLREMLEGTGLADVTFANPDLDPFCCRGFDVVVAGPGGILYAEREGLPEYRNLVNYLKFAFIAREVGAEFWLIGVSDQQSPSITNSPPLVRHFWRAALALCQLATARDSESAALLEQSGVHDTRMAQDLVFGLLPAARATPAPLRCGDASIALCGEWYAYATLQELARLLCAEGRETLDSGNFQLLVFSDDDLLHAGRLQQELRQAGHSTYLIDCRPLSLDRLLYLFKGFDLLLTTRFHAMVLAMLCKIRFVALDRMHGKKQRLLRSLGVEAAACRVDDEPESGALSLLETIAAGSAGVRLDDAVVDSLWRSASLHQSVVSQRLQQLLQREPMIFKKKAPTSILAQDDGQTHVRLCWAASTPETQGFGNLGDSLSAVMVGALSGLPVRHTNFNAPGDKLVAVGSIAHSIRGGKAVLWGPGVSIRGAALADNVKVTEYDVRALRGAISASHLAGFGIQVPEVYGDPVWLLPSIFNEPVEKKYELGVIPHILEIDGYGPDAPPKADSLRYDVPPEWQDKVKVINTWHAPTWDAIKEKLRLILSCKRILSQSFHGVVIGETYGIPSMNFRNIPGRPASVIEFSTAAECTTDPRIYEFYKAAGVDSFPTFAQRRDKPSDWAKIIAAIDKHWKPLEVDHGPLIEAFPLPLAYDPRSESCPSFEHIEQIKF